MPRQDSCAEHISLTSLWLPDKRTRRTIGDLLPVIDLDVFEIDKDAVHDWLVKVANLRARIEEVTVEEWKEILSIRIPREAPAGCLMSDVQLRDRVMRWYEACLDTLDEQEHVSGNDFASCPLLCQMGEVWQYVSGDTKYLNNDDYLARVFAQDVWLFHIRARLHSGAVKYLGVPRLSDAVQIDITPGEPQSPLSSGLQERFDESLPYVWAWRSSQNKQAADRLSIRLKSLMVHVVPALGASLSMNGLSHQAEQRWHVMDDTIWLHSLHENESELAQALAKALDVRSEAEFYENLLRCNDGSQRKQKLLNKGMVATEVEMSLREYSASPPEEEPGDIPKIQGIQKNDTPHSPSTGGNEGSSMAPQKSSPLGIGPENKSQLAGIREPLRLKDPTTVDYCLGGPPEAKGGNGGGGGAGGGTGQEGRKLTDAEKSELEAAGRAFAVRELKRIGFSVEEMPQSNPGFDIRAKKEDVELRVEVKAHGGRATIVDVTQREYKEYLSQKGYRWQLWNVEYLAENDASPALITRYDTIPDDALDVRTFRVDLKRCQASWDSSGNLT